MKKKIKRIAVIAAAVLLAAGSIALYGLHRHQMKALRNDLTLEYEKEKHMEERIEAIRKERDSLNGEKQAQSDTIKDQSDKIEELEQKAKEMADQIDELLTEEVTVFDAGAVMEEIQNISELATVEYRYTNVGTLDASKKFSFIDWKNSSMLCDSGVVTVISAGSFSPLKTRISSVNAKGPAARIRNLTNRPLVSSFFELSVQSVYFFGGWP